MRLIIRVMAIAAVASMLGACQTASPRISGPPKAQEIEAKDRISKGIKADYRVADDLNKIEGVRGSAVLIHNNKAYVGVHVIGPEKNPDPYMKKGPGTITGNQPLRPGAPGINRGPNSGTGQGLSPNLNTPSLDGHSSGSIANGEAPGNMSTQTGNIDPHLVTEIQRRVKALSPNVQKVFVTANNDNVSQLQGYARFIQDNGNMQPFVDRFKNTVMKIWPDAKP